MPPPFLPRSSLGRPPASLPRDSPRMSLGSHPKCFSDEPAQADSASRPRCRPCQQPNLLPRCRFYFVGAQHRCALRHRPNSQPNPLPPPSGTPYVHESPCIAPPRMAQTCYPPPLLSENYNSYTSSGRTAPARKSRASSSPKNSSTPLPQPATRPDTPNGTMGA